MLEGRQGFYGLWLNFMQSNFMAQLKIDTIGNNRIVNINLIKMGIAMIPDPKKEYRPQIYKAIEDEIQKGITEHIEEYGENPSHDALVNITYNAHITMGLGGITDFMDKLQGLVVKNEIIRVASGRK